MSASKRSVLITGCSAGGIGAGLAEVFSEKGYHVFATLRNPAKLPPSLSKSSNVTPLTLDVLSPESIARAVSDVAKQTGGRLDVLVNNSGQNFVRPALDVSLEEGRKPLLIEARGHIVNQSSAAGYVPFTFMSQFSHLSPTFYLGTAG
jgi:1-acylglycerone phosphate reductase